MPLLTNLYVIINISVNKIPIPTGKITPKVYAIPMTNPSRYSGQYNGTKNDTRTKPIIIYPGNSEPIVKKKESNIPNNRAAINL